MRIRKNTNLSALRLPAGPGGGEKAQTHVCHLNQSPWDVIPFSSSAGLTNNLNDSSWWFLPSSSSSSPQFHQFDGDDSFNGNVSLGDSNGAAESVVSVDKLDFMRVDDNEKSADEEPTDQFGFTKSGIKGKKGKAHEPNSSVKSSGDKTSAAATSTAPPPSRRGRPRGTVKKPSAAVTTAATATTNPYEFYYYSGFGPRWGKRRGGDNGGGGKSVAEEETVMSANGGSIIKNNNNHNNNNYNNGGKNNNVEENKTMSFENHDDDSMEDEDEEVDQGNDSVKLKKRGRKPVKARSLKSLM